MPAPRRPRRPLANPLEQLGWSDPESARQPHDGRESRLTSRSLEERDLGSVETARLAECLLRQADALPVAPQVLSEALVRGGHGEESSVSDDKRSTDKTSRVR